jgi:hypothetical protein
LAIWPFFEARIETFLLTDGAVFRVQRLCLALRQIAVVNVVPDAHLEQQADD